MSLKQPNSKPNTVGCITLSHVRSLEAELEHQYDKVKGLEHDIAELKTSLVRKDTSMLESVNAAREESRARHEMELEEIRKKHQHDLQSIQNAQTKYDQSLTDLALTCEGFEQDNATLTRIITKQKRRLKELAQLRMDDEHMIKKLTEGLKAIDEGDSRILNGVKEVCFSQEAELTKNAVVIEELKEKCQDLELEKTRSEAVLETIFKLMKHNCSTDPKIGEAEETHTEKGNGKPFDEQLLELKKVIKQMMNRNQGVKHKSYLRQSPSSSPPRPLRIKSQPQSRQPQIFLAPRTNHILKKKNESKHKVENIIAKLNSFETESTSTNSPLLSSSKSHQIPRSTFGQNKSTDLKQYGNSSSKSSLNHSIDSEEESLPCSFPNREEIKLATTVNGTSKEISLKDIVNRTLSEYYGTNANTDENQTHQFITKKSLKSHTVQEFSAQTQFWYSTLSIGDTTWDPSDPSIGFRFSGGLVGSRMGKIVYRTRECATDALLLFVLKSIDSQGKWTETFLGPTENSCILRKEGELRNNQWLALIRKGGHVFAAFVKDVGVFKKPTMMF